MKMTSAYANKLLKQLEEEKNYWTNLESTSCLYTAAIGEEAVIPEYDYKEVAEHIEEIDRKVCVIKHAVNLSNITGTVVLSEGEMSVDTVLVRMAQLNKRKQSLDFMRKQQPKTRLQSGSYSGRGLAPEYQYINYDRELIKEEFERISAQIMEMQMALDRHNQTVEFEVAI